MCVLVFVGYNWKKSEFIPFNFAFIASFYQECKARVNTEGPDHGSHGNQSQKAPRAAAGAGRGGRKFGS